MRTIVAIILLAFIGTSVIPNISYANPLAKGAAAFLKRAGKSSKSFKPPVGAFTPGRAIAKSQRRIPMRTINSFLQSDEEGNELHANDVNGVNMYSRNGSLMGFSVPNGNGGVDFFDPNGNFVETIN